MCGQGEGRWLGSGSGSGVGSGAGSGVRVGVTLTLTPTLAGVAHPVVVQVELLEGAEHAGHRLGQQRRQAHVADAVLKEPQP